MASTAAGAAPAATAAMPSTDEAWKLAQKLRAAIQKELEYIQRGGPGTNEIARFEKVEKLMENYRLACIETIWPDIRAAREKGAEDVLWHTHTQVTKAYRKVLGRAQGHDHAVLRRRLERLYSTYLKTAQYFYRGYLQRVCARYDMQDLKRIARQAELEDMAVPDAVKVDPATAHLEEVVRTSCHKTLIYLGDLSRYRTLMRSKDRKWDGALSYYFLANELSPESGYGHHQCSVIYVEIEDHLEVVYHLYRSLACDKPHPNAPTNLKREFSDLLKRKTTGIKHALVNWFVKLHAFYFQGNEFAERKELETEVDNRLVVAMKKGTGLGSDDDLLKIILINICAYIGALARTRAEWTDEGSRSCQMILRWNVRTIQAISRVLGDELTDLIKRRTVETSDDNSNLTSQTESSSKFTPAFSRVLPLLRVYMAWLCSSGPELVEFRPHLEPHFVTMCTALSSTLTLLFELLGTSQKLGNTVSWRFPEDEMTLGMTCLNGPALHDGCQLYYDAFTRRPKPRREDVPNADYTEDDITFTRALDIILCAIDLSAPESKFPLVISTTADGTTVTYLEGGKPDPTPSLSAARSVIPDDGSHATSAVQPAVMDTSQQIPEVPPSPCESNELSEDQEFYGPSLRRASNATHRTQAGQINGSTQVMPVSEFPIEKQLFKILNDFMAPPESATKRKPETPARAFERMSAYGVDSAASAEGIPPMPGSAGAKAFPTLPWKYFYDPDSATRNSRTSTTAPGWNGDGSGSPRPNSSGNFGQYRGGAPPGIPLAHHSENGYENGYDNGDQLGLLDHEAAVLRSLNLGSELNDPANPPLGGGYSTQGSWSGVHGDANFSRQSAWTPSVRPWQAGHGQARSAERLPNSPFSSLDFSGTASSLPPVNSPWGMSAAAPRFPAQGGPSGSAPAQAPSSPRHFGTWSHTRMRSGANKSFQQERT
ncbi:hypothetical protein VTK26DRAFT_5698 [Humicola hyalothermophila]